MAWPDEAVASATPHFTTETTIAAPAPNTDSLTPMEPNMETKITGAAPSKTTQILNTLQNDAVESTKWATSI